MRPRFWISNRASPWSRSSRRSSRSAAGWRCRRSLLDRRPAVARLRAVGGRPAGVGRGRHSARRDVRVRRSRGVPCGSSSGASARSSLVGVLAAGCAATKIEGTVFAIALFTPLVVLGRRGIAPRRGCSRRPSAVAALAIGILPWRIWLAVHHVPRAGDRAQAHVAIPLAGHLDRLPRALAYLAWRALDPRAWILLVPLCVAVPCSPGAGAHRSRRSRPRRRGSRSRACCSPTGRPRCRSTTTSQRRRGV